MIINGYEIEPGANLSGADLSRANLPRANLSGADLSEANLVRANLSEANLYGANLFRASLSEASLCGADLSGADLSGADLCGANLSGADLCGANLSRADLSGANLFWADLSRADLSGANLPAPTMVLLASWGNVPHSLCLKLMWWDSINHPNPSAFDAWAQGGSCPYDDICIGRAANFHERKNIWRSKPYNISLNPYELMIECIKAKCAKSDWHGKEKNDE